MGEYRTELLGLQAIFSDGLATVNRLLDQEAKPVEVQPEPRWMRVKDYARARSMSPRTVHQRIADGMPTIGSGRGRMIVVADADAWLARRVRDG